MFGGMKSATIGVFTPWKLASTVHEYLLSLPTSAPVYQDTTLPFRSQLPRKKPDKIACPEVFLTYCVSSPLKPDVIFNAMGSVEF